MPDWATLVLAGENKGMFGMWVASALRSLLAGKLGGNHWCFVEVIIVEKEDRCEY